MNDIPYSWGTAVNVQPMVFGNLNDNSGTGVAFTRDPATGEKALFGEYLINAQGEDVVAGVRTPMPIAKLEEDMPEVYEQFAADLPTRWRTTIATCRTWSSPLKTASSTCSRPATASAPPPAALKIAVRPRGRGHDRPRRRPCCAIEPKQLDTLLHPQFDAEGAEGGQAHRQGPRRLPGRCLRQGRLHR